MFVKQISIFVENKFGRIAKIIDLLGEKNINISALSIADTTDFGILRLIVNKPEEAVAVLKENGVMAKSTNVIAVAIDDQPGSLSNVLGTLTKAEITIEYMYAFVGKKEDKALMVVRTDDMDKSVEAFKAGNIEIITSADVYWVVVKEEICSGFFFFYV